MRKGQSVLEFTMVVFACIVALIAMQVYVKRSMQGRLRNLGDELGQHYAPRNTGSNIITTQFGSTTTITNTIETGTTTNTTSDITETRSGTEALGSLESSLF
ncbi:MAG: hypothetical protein ABIH27_01575 [Candidatus Omnitrophota bacterium]